MVLRLSQLSKCRQHTDCAFFVYGNFSGARGYRRAQVYRGSISVTNVTPERSEPARRAAAFHPPPPRQHPAPRTNHLNLRHQRRAGARRADHQIKPPRLHHPAPAVVGQLEHVHRHAELHPRRFPRRQHEPLEGLQLAHPGRTTLAWRSRTYNCATSTPLRPPVLRNVKASAMSSLPSIGTRACASARSL